MEDSLQEQRINLVLLSYGLESLLEQNDIEEYTVVSLLLARGLMTLDDYFYEDVPDEEIDEWDQE